MSAGFDPMYDEPQTIGEHIKKFFADVKLAKQIDAELNDQAAIDAAIEEFHEAEKAEAAEFWAQMAADGVPVSGYTPEPEPQPEPEAEPEAEPSL